MLLNSRSKASYVLFRTSFRRLGDALLSYLPQHCHSACAEKPHKAMQLQRSRLNCLDPPTDGSEYPQSQFRNRNACADTTRVHFLHFRARGCTDSETKVHSETLNPRKLP